MSNASSVTLTPGAAAQSGDTIVVIVMTLSSRTWTLPTGFVKYGRAVTDGQTEIQVFIKRALSGEPASYAFNPGTGTYGGAFLQTYTGVADVGPISYWDEDEQSGTSVTWPNISVPVTGGAALVVATTQSAATLSTPSGWTAGYTNARGKTFDILNPSTGTLTGPSSTASADEAHTLLSMFLTPTLQAPTNLTEPSLSGNNWNGQSLSLDMGEWIGVSDYDYVVWKRDGVAI